MFSEYFKWYFISKQINNELMWKFLVNHTIIFIIINFICEENMSERIKEDKV